MIKNEYRCFLIDRARVDRIGHSGRTLFDHLMGTHALLRCWLAAEHVCVAGLFHSIYGTRSFRKQAWPLDDRSTIRALIGLQAERLAHMFGTLDRSKAFFLRPDTETLQQLREIEAANLIEQGSHGKQLQRLRASALRLPVAHALDEYLQEAA